MQVRYERDIAMEALTGKRIAIIGYGSQGRAQALNLRDGGHEVVVGLRPDSPSRAPARAAGLPTVDIGEAARFGDVIMLLTPDEVQAPLYHEHVQPGIRPGSYLGFAHGFAIHYGQIVPSPEVGVFLVAPKGIGPLVRQEYEAGRGVPALVAVHQDPTGRTLNVALAYACGLGCGRAGILESTFREETETDLFGEQAVLCGGLTELIRAGYETLVGAGYAPELAYCECVHEVKLIADLIHERGIAGMRAAISRTAAYGDLTRGARVIGPATRAAMREVLDEIRSGAFAREWIAECAAGKPLLAAQAAEVERSELESVGQRVRALMPWLGKRPGRD